MQPSKIVLDHFINTIPKKPYASDDLMYGVKIYSKDAALRKVYLQPNHPYYLHNIVFDLDYSASLVEILYSKTGIPYRISLLRTRKMVEVMPFTT